MDRALQHRRPPGPERRHADQQRRRQPHPLLAPGPRVSGVPSATDTAATNTTRTPASAAHAASGQSQAHQGIRDVLAFARVPICAAR